MEAPLSQSCRSSSNLFTFEPIDLMQTQHRIEHRRKNSYIRISIKQQKPTNSVVKKQQSSIKLKGKQTLTNAMSCRKLISSDCLSNNFTQTYKPQLLIKKIPLINSRQLTDRKSNKIPTYRNSLKFNYGSQFNEFQNFEAEEAKLEMLKIVIQSPKIENTAESSSDEEIYEPKYSL
ncbi:unnamed protein product [Blepharisma stoltei]|uniref:Uncharacterized protein n=1 Tax=Blepharisma stoltei TaxID=1481888 RepID=A0AAU9JCP1_9CILI|nr:unnamed protein product [Blepharisma stoltei]